MSRAASELGMPVIGIVLRFLLMSGSGTRKTVPTFPQSITPAEIQSSANGQTWKLAGRLDVRACRSGFCPGSVRHDLGDAKQDDEREEQEIDIRLHFAGVAKPADLADDLLARGRCIRPFGGDLRQTSRLPLEPFDALEERERAQRRGGVHPRIDQHEDRNHSALWIFFQEVEAEIDQRQEHEVGDESIGVAQERHSGASNNIGSAAWRSLDRVAGDADLRERCNRKATSRPTDPGPIATSAAENYAFLPESIGLRPKLHDLWCARRDSNPHDFTHCHLKAARLPIPPRALWDTGWKDYGLPDQRRGCNKSEMGGQGGFATELTT